MVTPAYTPDRGHVIWLNFSPQEGHEQAGMRPALVLSARDYNQKTSLLLACPITSKVKGYPFEVRLKTKIIDGVVLADQIKSLDWRVRKAELVDKAPPAILSQTQELIQTLLG